YFVRVRARNSAGLSLASNEVQVVVGAGPGPCGTPGAPSALTAAVNESTVTLSWSPPTSGCQPTTYGIEAGSSPGATNVATVLTGNTQTSFTATNVPAGTYYVRVRAGAGSTIGAASNEVVVNVVGGAPPSGSVT